MAVTLLVTANLVTGGMVMKDGFIQAFRKGNAITRLSAIILGLGNLAGKQIIKGILYLAIEVSFICFMIFKGINCLAMLPSLGGR